MLTPASTATSCGPAHVKPMHKKCCREADLNHAAVVTLNEGCVGIHHLLQQHLAFDQVAGCVNHMLHHLLQVNLQLVHIFLVMQLLYVALLYKHKLWMLSESVSCV